MRSVVRRGGSPDGGLPRDFAFKQTWRPPWIQVTCVAATRSPRLFVKAPSNTPVHCDSCRFPKTLLVACDLLST